MLSKRVICWHTLLPHFGDFILSQQVVAAAVVQFLRSWSEDLAQPLRQRSTPAQRVQTQWLRWWAKRSREDIYNIRIINYEFNAEMILEIIFISFWYLELLYFFFFYNWIIFLNGAINYQGNYSFSYDNFTLIVSLWNERFKKKNE